MTPTENSSPPGETKEGLLLEAERLLRESGGHADEETGPVRSFLVFRLAGEWYAVDLVHVRKILHFAPIAKVPGAAPEVLGLMNCQGEVLAVLDLLKVIGAGKGDRGSAVEDKKFVLILQFGEKEAGILVDAVENTCELPVSEILPALDSLEPEKARFFEGTAVLGNRFVGLLNVSICLNP